MSKVRVYELAKELNLESKQLVDKLQAGGLNVKNYMSTLDEDDIKRAHEIVSGVVQEIVEEKRVKPTVIRRRKKVQVEETPEVKAEEEQPPIVEPTEAPKAEELPLGVDEERQKGGDLAEGVEVKEPSAKVVEEPVVSGPAPEEEPAEEPVIREPIPETPVEEISKPKKAKKKKVEQPAKIIKTIKRIAEAEPEKAPGKPMPEVPSVEEKIPSDQSVSETEEDVGATDRAKEKKGGKKKKGLKKADDKSLEKRGVFRWRKKEVYERADLYLDRGITRKGKKGAAKGKMEVQKGKHTEITVPKAIKRRLKVPEFVTVAELAKSMGVKASELLKTLMSSGQVATINQSIDFETASVVADDFGYELTLDAFEETSLIAETADREEDLAPRPPVVTIMGHVDHGKTLLLDYIRNSNVVDGESGGITQHIGAYYVKRDSGDVVFLDTPGHEAFTSMRARGAQVTDIIVLVVAADDGVMPQTRESIDHARAANIPIVVAINKIDKPDANPDRVKRDLATAGVAAEDWGGDTLMGHVSAKTGEGVDDLLGLILLQAEMMELKANPAKEAKGTVIEAKLDKSKGPVATILIKNGSLQPGNQFICGEHYGRVRAMLNHRGNQLKTAGPSMPVEIYGMSGVPKAGDDFIVVQDEKTAKQISENRKRTNKLKEIGPKGIVSLEDLYQKIKEGEVKELNIILKTDVQGSVEALSDLLLKQSTSEVKLKIIHMATGTITESDVMLASASNAIIIGFNVRANARVSELAKKERIDIRYYDVIYNAVKDIRAAMTGLLEPVFKERIIGRAYIKEIFHVPKVGAVSGCQVSDGHVERNAGVRLLRDGVIVYDGKISSLRRFKDDVKEVQSGFECGIGLLNFNDIKLGDEFEFYLMEETAAEL